MNSRGRVVVWVAVLSVLFGIPAAAQVLRPTPAPTVTAENEPWFLNGDPITHAGNLYYPGGAQVFFNPNEMVRSGSHFGIPLYSRTTIEPFSIVYVPVAGGLMQPYERPRAGELAGTSGSRPAAAATPYEIAPGGPAPLQAPAPPTGMGVPSVVITDTAAARSVQTPAPVPIATTGTTAAAATARPTGTAGRRRAPARAVHTTIGSRPTGINAVFIEFDNARWYSHGRSVELDTARMERIGDYNGFEVWAERGDRSRIYVPATRGGTIVVPYARTKPQGN